MSRVYVKLLLRILGSWSLLLSRRVEGSGELGSLGASGTWVQLWTRGSWVLFRLASDCVEGFELSCF